MNFEITENAARRILQLAEQEGKPNLKLRVTVLGGGCSGFQYSFELVDSVQANDIILKQSGAEVVMDDISLEMLSGSKLDYEEELGSAAFKIVNPNATAKCGCGNSFSI